MKFITEHENRLPLVGERIVPGVRVAEAKRQPALFLFQPCEDILRCFGMLQLPRQVGSSGLSYAKHQVSPSKTSDHKSLGQHARLTM